MSPIKHNPDDSTVLISTEGGRTFKVLVPSADELVGDPAVSTPINESAIRWQRKYVVRQQESERKAKKAEKAEKAEKKPIKK